MKTVVESTGRVGSRCQIGNHTLVFDQPVTAPGGGDRGPSPLDVMVASVAACAHYFASAYLHARGILADSVTVAVESEKDREPVSRIGRLTMTIHLPAGLSAQQIAGIERAVKSCPAYGTLKHPPTVEISVAADAARQSA